MQSNRNEPNLDQRRSCRSCSYAIVRYDMHFASTQNARLKLISFVSNLLPHNVNHVNSKAHKFCWKIISQKDSTQVGVPHTLKWITPFTIVLLPLPAVIASAAPTSQLTRLVLVVATIACPLLMLWKTKKHVCWRSPFFRKAPAAGLTFCWNQKSAKRPCRFRYRQTPNRGSSTSLRYLWFLLQTSSSSCTTGCHYLSRTASFSF